MLTPRGEQRLQILWTISMVLASLLALWLLYLLRNVLISVYISALLAIGISPAVRWIERRQLVSGPGRVPRWAAILVLYVGLLVAIAAVLLVTIPPLAAQTSELWTQLPKYEAQIQATLEQRGLMTPGTNLMEQLPSPGDAFEGLLGAAESVFGALGLIVTILLLPYYLLVEGDAIERGMLQLVSKDQRPALASIAHDVTIKVGAWLRGQAVLCLTIAVSATLGLWLLGVPFFYVLGLIAGLGELVPIVGPLIAAVPAVLMALTVSPKTMLFVIVYFSVQQFIEGSVLVPRIMERQVGVSAITVIIGLLVGSELLGMVGALLAVPTAAIMQVLFQEYFGRDPA